MKQLVQSLKNEGTILIDSEIPQVSKGKVLINTIVLFQKKKIKKEIN